MAFKLAVFSCFVVFAHGSVLPAGIASLSTGAYAAAYGVPVAAAIEDCNPLPQYKFGYDVADTLTGDYKSQVEQRDGDTVQGQYSLVESDGTLRIVEYSADSVNGFNAVVRNEPLSAAAPFLAEPAVVPTRVAAAAPIISQPALTSTSVFARYATPSKVVASPTAVVAPGPVTAPVYPSFSYTASISAPWTATAPYTATIAAPYTAPYVASAYAASYAAPFAAAYNAPVATYSNLVANSLPGSVVGEIPKAAPPPAFTAFRPASAKLVEPVVTAGCP